ncbi:phage regulatory protein/antirepressor Ant [Ponticaulis profundi]|uniref:Phage regulatory protein/antirepressor Ant n=1 Tax=Ponticaulis profundi TaxID=2665222 RepID=A0ABW1S8F9_9PROT
MTDLVQADGPQTMSSREIAELCEARHNDVCATIVRLFDRGVLRESRKTTRAYKLEEGGRPTKVYDLTKRDTLVVVSGYKDEIRARIIDRWQELEQKEKAGNDPARMLSDPAILRQTLLTYTEKVIELEAKIEEDAPKVEALERISEAEGSLCITDAAKALQMRPKDLFSYMTQHGWIYKRPGGGHYLGYQSKVTQGVLEHKVTTVLRPDGSEKITEQVRVTPKGISRLAQLIPPAAAA